MIVNALHPGVIQTGLARHMPKIAVVLMSEWPADPSVLSKCMKSWKIGPPDSRFPLQLLSGMATSSRLHIPLCIVFDYSCLVMPSNFIYQT